MFCKNCGKEIDSDSKFCNFCGAKQQSEIPSEEQESEIQLEQQTPKVQSEQQDSKLVLYIIYFFIALFLVITMLALSKGCDDCTGGTTPTNSSQANSQKAKNSDVIVSYERFPGFLSEDEYIMTLQAQEKIKNLEIIVYYESANGTTLKTKTITANLVVPGNEYTYDLDLGGMKVSDLDKISAFSYNVIGGTIID